MREWQTMTGTRFRYGGDLDSELIVYTSGKDGKPQDKSALVITPYVIKLVQRLIRTHWSILMGASRDNPPRDSLGWHLKRDSLAPQQLSYLISILQDAGRCHVSREGRGYLVKSVES